MWTTDKDRCRFNGQRLAVQALTTPPPMLLQEAPAAAASTNRRWVLPMNAPRQLFAPVATSRHRWPAAPGRARHVRDGQTDPLQ